MDICHSGDQIARDHIHTYITTCNIEDLQQKYRLGMASKRSLGVLGGGLNMFYRAETSPSASAVVQNIWSV